MLYLHAGTVKTGTTYLQKTFHLNREVFQRHGLDYLPVDPEDLDLPRYANAKFLYDRSLVEVAQVRIDAASHRNVLISEEGIFGNVEHLRNEEFRKVPKKIILYVRPTAEVLSAWAAELAQPYNTVVLPGEEGFHPTGRRILSLERTLECASHEYAISLGRFIAIVDEIGRENFIVRPFETSALVDGSLLRDFLHQINVDADAILSDPDFEEVGKVNMSASRKFFDVSRAVWRELGRPHCLSQFDVSLVESIYRLCQSGDDRPIVETISDEQIEWYIRRFSHFENFVSQTFLQGAPLFENRYPKCFGIDRKRHIPISRHEVRILINKRLAG